MQHLLSWYVLGTWKIQIWHHLWLICWYIMCRLATEENTKQCQTYNLPGDEAGGAAPRLPWWHWWSCTLEEYTKQRKLKEFFLGKKQEVGVKRGKKREMVFNSHILMQTEIVTPQWLNFEQELLQEHLEHHTVGFFFFFFFFWCLQILHGQATDDLPHNC